MNWRNFQPGWPLESGSDQGSRLLPRWITQAPGGEGFAELAAALLEAR